MVPAPDGGLEVSADTEALDAYVIALGRTGVAVRVLERRARSLESLFLELTGHADAVDGSRAGIARRRGRPASLGGGLVSIRGVRAVAGVECSKLAAQFKARIVLAACALGPFAFAAAMRVQSSLPTDTLFGRAVKESGFAVSLVVLGFAALWAFPVLTSVVGGDLFSAEDRYGTWSTVLTRSRSRAEVFAGKVLDGDGLLPARRGRAGGEQRGGRNARRRARPLIDLSGALLAPAQALTRVALAWASVLPPAFGFTALAVLLSVATRSSAAGIGLPVRRRADDAALRARGRSRGGAAPAHHHCFRVVARTVCRARLLRAADPRDRGKRGVPCRLPGGRVSHAAAAGHWRIASRAWSD